MKQKPHALKILRVALALVFTLPLFIYFLSFSKYIPFTVRNILHLQFIPELLLSSVLCIVTWIVITFLFGRIYCSVICPAGVLQDVFIHFAQRKYTKKKKKKKQAYTYHRAQNKLRYGILALIIILTLTLGTTALAITDPYSNFGRICTNLLRPIIIFTNNLFAQGLAALGNYTLYHITLQYITTASVVSALIILVVFVTLSIRRGRLYCNTLCPVGATLSLFSFKPLFAISFDKDNCNNCGNCEKKCKSECISSKKKTVDNSRCVACFNCISSCSKGGLQYRFNYSTKQKAKQPFATPIAYKKPFESNSRRTFLQSTLALTLTSSLVPNSVKAINTNNAEKKSAPITPPGSHNRNHFENTCTACHLCVAKCPNQILKPVGLKYGINYLLKPEMIYQKAYCNYECTLCTAVCPTGALTPLTVEEKKTTQIGIAHFERELCVTITQGTDCGACSEHCPTQAVKMVTLKGSLRMPEVNPNICIGCGGCEYICPVKPNKAIHIVAQEEQKTVNKPTQDKVEDKKVDTFGF